jgi:hypothetical protein
MLLSLGLAFLALRAGLALRRTRLRRSGRTPDLRARHLRLAKPAVAMVTAGFVGGLVSWVWLRGGEMLGSFHGLVGLLVMACFLAAAVLGHRIEAGRSRALDAHALFGGLAVLLAALAAVAGFALLP